MHKKLEAELIHLAHQILKINKDTNIGELRDRARDVYENLSVLSFIDGYFVNTPEVTGNKEAFLDNLTNLPTKKIEVVTPKTSKPEVAKVEKVEVKRVEPVVSKKEETDKLVEQTIKTIKSEAKEIVNKIQETPKVEKIVEVVAPKVEEKSDFDIEMKNSIPADVAADMFEKLEKKVELPKVEVPKVEKPVVEELKTVTPEKPKVNIATKQEVPETKNTAPKTTSLNDRISNQKLQVGLNDRIAFVKHLFNFSQEDFNTVLSQLNSFQSEKECLDFIKNDVKLKHDWTGKEEYEDRLMVLIDRKFK